MDIEELQSVAGQRYDVEGFLAEGGMGAIYTARHRSLGSRVAIKVLPREVAASEVRLARFRREAALAANLSHPNIVPVFEFEATPRLAYLVMPYVGGETLADQLAREGRMEYQDVHRMLGQVANALGFAHSHDVVHRDIKPANILREEATGRWLVTDFGIAHVTGPTDSDITQTGTVIGTPAYMSPEQRWGGQVDGRSDLYSLAAVAYQAISGTPTDQLPTDLLKERAELERAMRKAQPRIRPEVARALTWPLETAKDDRPESAAAWLEALDRADGIKLRVRWAWAGSIAAVAIAAGLLLFGHGSESSGSTASHGVTTVAIFPFQGIVQGDSVGVKATLPQLLELQLQYLPDEYTVLPEYETDVQSPSGRLELARRHNASLALLGSVSGTSNAVNIEIQVHDVVEDQRLTTLRRSGPVDSLPQLMADLVVQLMDREAIDVMGWEAGVLRNLDLEALQSYWEGERDLREGRYQAAVDRFDEVIRSDSTFALAHFKRMLAALFAARPSRYSQVVGTALEAASAYSDRLPPLSRQLLQAYEILLLRGDVDSAVALARDLALRKPRPDTYSLLGYVLFNFRALLGEPPAAAAHYFQEAVELDSSYALALWHLAVIEMREGNRAAAQQYVDRFRQVDSTSIWAEVVILGDSVLYGGRLPNLPQSFRNLELGALELMIVPLGELEAPSGMTPASSEALRIFWERAQTDYDRQLAFRMRMAERLARGRFAGADSLIDEGQRAGVSRDEIDRWIVLSIMPPLPPLATTEERRAAVRRLENNVGNDAEAAWLVARWYLAEEPSLAASRIELLRSIAQSPATTSPLPGSLELDIRAIQAMTTGDTSAALQLWDEATQRYSVVDDFLFGLTASLWPLRWRQIQVLAASGRPADAEQALEIADTFEQMFGFVDQVAWPEVLLREIDAALTLGDRAAAARSRRLLEAVLVRDRYSPAAHELRSRARSKLEPQSN